MTPSPTCRTVRSTRSASSGLTARQPCRRRARSSSSRRPPRCPRPRARRGGRAPAAGPLQVGLPLALAGLVVDQLVATVGQAVDAVDAAAHVVGADLEVEPALQPDRLALRLALALPVEPHRLAGAVAELQLVVAGAEPRAPPAGLEEAHQPARARPRSRLRSLWKRSRTLWMRIPKRWLIVGSWGIPKTRVNLYFSGQVR